MTLISFYLFILIGRFITSKTKSQIGKTVDTQTQTRKHTDTDTHTSQFMLWDSSSPIPFFLLVLYQHD